MNSIDIPIFPETLPSKTAVLLNGFQQKNPAFLQDFYLSGGTALALQLGHRESEDLDFFTQNHFNPELIQAKLIEFGRLDKSELADGTLNTFVDGVKLQFLEYPYILLQPQIKWNNCKLSSIIDIACTKLITISSRGSKKDFIDLFFLLKKYSLKGIFAALPNKYKNISYNQVHIMKSLIYFDEAEGQPMPKMHINASWDEVKETIAESVRGFDL